MKAILFDFDGTLVETQSIYNAALSHVLSAYNKKYTEDYCAQFFNGKCWNDTLSKLALQENFNPKEVFAQGFELAQKQIKKGVLVTSGTFDALNFIIKNTNISIYICSNARTKEILPILRQTKLHAFFNESNIFGRELVKKGKPSSQIYLKCLKDTGLNPQDALTVEDSVSGAKASVLAGIKTLVFAGGKTFGGMQEFDAEFSPKLQHIKNMMQLVSYIA